MATKNAINNKSQDLTVDPGASGDSFVQFDINTTGEFRIGVDDTDDSFRISQGSALGTNDTFVMTASGERTMPLQPAFLATLETQDANVTGDATVFQLGSGNALTEVFDVGSHFNTNGTFTAPITGRYCLSAGIHMEGLTASHTNGQLQITTSNGSYFVGYLSAGAVRSINNKLIFAGSIICDMDASDTATTSLTVAGGSKVVDIETDNRDTRLSGVLIC